MSSSSSSPIPPVRSARSDLNQMTTTSAAATVESPYAKVARLMLSGSGIGTPRKAEQDLNLPQLPKRVPFPSTFVDRKDLSEGITPLASDSDKTAVLKTHSDATNPLNLAYKVKRPAFCSFPRRSIIKPNIGDDQSQILATSQLIDSEDIAQAKSDALENLPTKIYHLIAPPSPGKKWPDLIFSHPLNRSIFHDALIRYGINAEQYVSPTKRTCSIIKQSSLKNCGAACALMLALDQKIFDPAKNYILPLSYDFINWFFTSELSNGKEIVSYLNNEGVNAKLLSFQRSDYVSFSPAEASERKIFNTGEDILNHIDNLINENQNSVIMSIDHEKIGGHWVIIDHIDNISNLVYLRDPSSGKVFVESKEEIANVIYNPETGSLKNECIYIKK